ncbi:MAG TPA: zinc ABC transporter substrate-binding protein, partial [Acidimicrobiales bacterium]|nr:zinc ABC transporter substrate-binding protein [Acidimicrobiales bacterium]
GDNPHLWYGPEAVHAVAGAITTELKSLAPQAAAYFDNRAASWRAEMRPYDDEVARVRRLVGGSVAYVASEPVFDYMARSIGLVDETPRGYERAAANQVEPAPGDLHELERALRSGSIDVLIVNTQTASSISDQLRAAARSAGVPVVDVTESPPRGTSFVSWQVGELDALAKVLDR